MSKQGKNHTHPKKNSKEEDPGNYRPVSLILVPRKITGQMYRQK